MARRTRFRGLFGPDPQADVDEELAFHLEMRTRDAASRGAPAEQARDLALTRLGDLERARRECVAITRRNSRRMALRTLLADVVHDVSFALRLLRRTPGVTLTAVLTLALGIGATTAIYAVVHAVLLRPLPYPEPAQLHVLQMHYPDGTRYDALSAPDFMSVRQQSRAFTQVEALDTGLATLVGVGEPREIRVAEVSDGAFRLLDLRAGLGRTFLAEEHQPGRARVVVLDHGFWTRVFGADDAVIGRVITIGAGRYEVVGVLREGARLPTEADVYRPLAYGPTFDAATAEGRRSEFLTVIGRARPDLSLEAIRADLQRVGGQLQRAFPATNARLSLDAQPVLTSLVGDVRTPLLMLLGAVSFVLLVACANVAHLLLARAASRRGELGVRAALGATRSRLLRQLLVESVVLGLAGGAVGLVIAWLATRALVAAQPADIPRLAGVGVDGTVFAVGLVSALAAGLLLGVLPAWQSSGRELTRALREGGRDAAARGGAHRLRGALVVAEIALAVVLLTGAGLLVRSLVALSNVDPGFRPEQVLTFRLTLSGDDYERGDEVRRRTAELLERLRDLRGVSSAGLTSTLPLSGLGAILDFAVEGQPPPPPHVNQEIAVATVTPGYFETIGVQVVRGRGITAQDRDNGTPVAVINEAGVRQWFGGQDPVGRHVLRGGRREIVGVVRDVRQRTLGAAVVPQLFVPYAQQTPRAVRVVVRGEGPLSGRVADIRRVVRELDPTLAVTDVTPLGDVITASLARPRFYASLLLTFAIVALALAATGVFGVMSHAVAQRAPELGIRLALGAHPRGVMRLVLRQSLALTAVGLIGGLGLALLLARALRSQLSMVHPADAVTLSVVVVTLGGTALVATLLPARRAARLDPARSLRD